MSEISENLKTIAANELRVYAAGANDFGMKKTVKDISPLVLKNVHPKEHDITVKVDTDVSTLTVTNGIDTFTFNENGVAKVKSISPETTLTLNKSDVALTAEYFVDVNNISEGVDTSDATATADEIFAGETAYSNGEKITGTFTIDNELTTQDDLISQIQTVLEGKAIGGGNTASYDTCTVNIVNILQNHMDIQGIAYVTVDSNENIVSIYDTIITSSYSCSCLCNSFIVVKLKNDSVSLDSSNIRYLGYFYSNQVRIYQIMATNGTTVTINVTAEVGGAE